MMKTYREFSEEQQEQQYTVKQQIQNVDTENDNFRQLDQVIRELFSKVDALESDVSEIQKHLKIQKK